MGLARPIVSSSFHKSLRNSRKYQNAFDVETIELVSCFSLKSLVA